MISMTFAAASVLALLALPSPSLSQECDCSPALRFRGDDLSQYGISEGSPESLTSLTVCFWMSVPRWYLRGHFATPLSYAAEGSHAGNEFTLILRPDLTLLITGERGLTVSTRTGVFLADGRLHHVCVTWESNGLFKVYKDGEMVKEMTNIRRSRPLESGGTWVLGQDQDVVGGGFALRDTFQGKLTGVNVWNRVLCPYEISRVGKDCGSIVKGNYKAYSDFTTSDSVEFTKPSCCPSDDTDM